MKEQQDIIETLTKKLGDEQNTYQQKLKELTRRHEEKLDTVKDLNERKEKSEYEQQTCQQKLKELTRRLEEQLDKHSIGRQKFLDRWTTSSKQSTGTRQKPETEMNSERFKRLLTSFLFVWYYGALVICCFIVRRVYIHLRTYLLTYLHYKRFRKTIRMKKTNNLFASQLFI